MAAVSRLDGQILTTKELKTIKYMSTNARNVFFAKNKNLLWDANSSQRACKIEDPSIERFVYTSRFLKVDFLSG
jgi:hypothetical protein